MKKQDLYSTFLVAGISLAIIILIQFILNHYLKMKIPVDGRLTSGYGNRVHPIQGGTKFHNGIDIAAPTGTPIKAPSSGKIIKKWTDSLNGNALQIKHNNGYTTGYAHMSAFNVNLGDTVKKGQTIGKVGSTGNSTGPHLHWTVKNKSGSTIDPEKVLA